MYFEVSSHWSDPNRISISVLTEHVDLSWHLKNEENSSKTEKYIYNKKQCKKTQQSENTENQFLLPNGQLVLDNLLLINTMIGKRWSINQRINTFVRYWSVFWLVDFADCTSLFNKKNFD